MAHPFLFLFIFIIVLSVAYTAHSAAPWVPTRAKDVERMLRLAQLRPGDRVFDLGCGDGRLVFTAAREQTVSGVGVELGLPFYAFAKIRSWFYKGKGTVKILYRDLFRVSLREANVVFVFLLPKSYDRLLRKFREELKPGTRVVVSAWPLPGWESTSVSRQEGQVPLYSYTV